MFLPPDSLTAALYPLTAHFAHCRKSILSAPLCVNNCPPRGSPPLPLTMVAAELTYPGSRATSLSVVILANNVLGFAPGSLVVGVLSETFGLETALTLAPLISLVTATGMILGSHYYEQDVRRLRPVPAQT